MKIVNNKNTLLGFLVAITVTFFIALFVSCGASSSKLVINTDTSDPDPKQAFSEAIEAFKAEYPDIEVEWNVFDHESFKTAVRNWLPGEAPDVITWYAANRMEAFQEKGFLEDITDLWEENDLYSQFGSTTASMTRGGRQWGVPYTYYQWGIFYRMDIFAENSIDVPNNWDEFIEAGKKLTAAGVTPVSIGTKYLWTAAGWFDYLNFRVNGADFHQELVSGRVAYTDDRVRETFKYWKQLVDADFFLKNHTSYSWQEAQPFLYSGEAAMYLIGNFITPMFPEEIADNMGFFQFPEIVPGVGMAEDAPTDTLHIPANAKNKENARLFLAFIARPEVQSAMNKTLNQVPANELAEKKDDRFIQQGAEMLANADAMFQFYDRDHTPEMASEGMKGFQEFMDNPSRLESILERLEAARESAYGPL